MPIGMVKQAAKPSDGALRLPVHELDRAGWDDTIIRIIHSVVKSCISHLSTSQSNDASSHAEGHSLEQDNLVVEI